MSSVGMNLAWAQGPVDGLVDGLGDKTLQAELRPREAGCCVRFRSVQGDPAPG